MNNSLSLSLFLSSLVIFIGYFVFSFRKNALMKENTLKNTFPFEVNLNVKVLSLLILLLSSLSLIAFFCLCFPLEYRYGFLNATMIAGIVAALAFFVINFINLHNIKAHFIVFCVLVCSNIALSILFGIGSITIYKQFNESIFLLLTGCVSIVAGLVEAILISPIFKFSLKMDTENEVLKKPSFIRMAFYEWIFGFSIFLESLLIVIAVFSL